MYLLVDFSNAARKAFTQIKKAELLGGMGKPKDQKAFDFFNKIYQKELKSKKSAKSNVLEQLNKVKEDSISYTDAAQIARRGKITPIKSKSYIDRASYITNPQDNTVLAGVIDKIENNTRKTNKEYGTGFYKDNSNSKLIAAKLSKGDEQSINIWSNFPSGRKALIDIHSHPIGTDKISRIGNVVPSPRDFQNRKGSSRTSLIVSPQNNNKRTITKYKTGFNFDESYIGFPSKYRKNVRNEGGDYTVITPNKNQ